ncbi:hypothetical protein [Desulfobacca acetoxidans]|uniref:Uncharacterized protein n=1 Tax=Desulfobacca acetoxidans (strain ATCC 700848 / DSM 11109 / ASRB2) TaxID=880072 RepID=F2NI53_DESAR|nr:hypothetical protein [Desulfobacca acetoxidans]AEB09822.1 hypothetical protein Desac_1991 [Desulfobacca acetoxidans DSM 11109]
MAVILFDQAKRRVRRQSKTPQGPGKILSLANLSDQVLLRVTKRQAAREMEYLRYLYQVTGGDPTMLPTLEQMQEIQNGTIEF